MAAGGFLSFDAGDGAICPQMYNLTVLSTLDLQPTLTWLAQGCSVCLSQEFLGELSAHSCLPTTQV